MWPLVLATFFGAWLAFHHHRHTEKRKAIDEQICGIKHTIFALSSQTDWLRHFIADTLEPSRRDVHRATNLEPVLIHDDFPRLNMKELPLAFDHSDFELMNALTAGEQSFFEIGRLLKTRATRLAALEVVDHSDPAGEKRYRNLLDGLHRLTDKLYEKVPALLQGNEELLTRLDDHLKNHNERLPVATVDYVSWYFLAGACAIAGVFFFSHWAVNTRSLAESGLDITLVSAVVFAISLYASLAVGILVSVLSVFSLVKRLKCFGIYFWTLVISMQPTVFLLWLDVS